MDKIECLICGATFNSYKSLHLHIGKKKLLSIEEYYHKFYPRYDLFSKELIRFKNREHYFKTIFNTKQNFINWFQKTESDFLKKNVVEILLDNRIKEKGIKNAFSQVELRTILAPSIITINKLFKDGYNELCSKLGLSLKFEYQNIELDLSHHDLNILIDSREQKPLSFFSSDKIKQLNCGDYTADEPYYDDVYIERKSVEDFFGTFGTTDGFKRFVKEVDRANKFGFYLFVLTDAPLEYICNYNHRWAQNSQSTILSSLANMRSLCQSHNNIQFIFVNGRDTSSSVIKKILQNKQSSTKYDWQFLIDSKIIC
jgi:hypothetical protein